MKTLKTLILLLFITVSTNAQNIQFHYDLGTGRKHPTTTIEMFKPDKWGNSFFFFDMNHNGDKGVDLSYLEIARCFKINKTPFSVHVEYNGGFTTAFPIEDAWLGGIDYSWSNKDFSKGFSIKTLYKNIREKDDASFQLTGVWYMHFFKRKLSFTGFVDFWKEEMYWGDKKFRFLTEPQIWYNINKQFSVGSEVEISSNFISNDLEIMPTVAIKYNF